MENEQKAFELTHQEFISLYQSNPKPINNEEKAKEIAEKNQKVFYVVGNSYNECYESAMAMARWKDERFEKEKQQWIDEACEFWEHKFPYIGVDTIEEFVDTMKGK